MSASTSTHDPMSQADALAYDLALAWNRGEALPAEHFLARYPHVRAHHHATLRVVYEEICQRELRGLALNRADWQQRFPDLDDEIAVMLECHALMHNDAPSPQFPDVGTIFDDFHLLVELGRGSAGRVFLAEQRSLGGRLVIVKMTPLDGGEHLKLARLQHTHIVPLFGSRDIPERYLRLLIMPCMGGVPLHALLQALRSRPIRQRNGSDWLQTMQTIAHPLMILAQQSAVRRFIESTDAIETVVWMGMCLAEGLHYAHERGLVHFDIKPSNVLLTSDGVPMLLDFHVAREPLCIGQNRSESLGGTPVYMAPEQKQAYADLESLRPLSVDVDHRADIFSLGLLLSEALTGQSPPAVDPQRFYREHSSHLSPGLRDILAHCLEQEPTQRYPNAGLLAEDFRRHLSHRPLRGVPNRSWRERWQKWRTRQPYALIVILLLTSTIAGLGVFTWETGRRLEQNRQELEGALLRAESDFAQGNYLDAAERLRDALHFHPDDASNGTLVERVQQRMREAMLADVLTRLHQRLDQLRFTENTTSASTIAELRSYWERREDLWTQTQWLPAPLPERLRIDLTEIAIILAETYERHHHLERHHTTLREAESLLGESIILRLERDSEPIPPQACIQAPTWQRVQIARRWVQTGRFDAAEELLQRTVIDAPDDFWAWFWLGQSAFKRGEALQAVAAFSTCLGHRPMQAECYFNRGRAWALAGQVNAAFDDYSQAIQRMPELGAAWLNRGVLHYQANRYVEALADLDQALAHGADPVVSRFNRALVNQRLGNVPAAQRDVEAVLAIQPQHVDAIRLRDILQENP